MTQRRTLPLLLIGFVTMPTVNAVDWMTLPSRYTHDVSGQRVAQYATPAPAYAPTAPNFRTSGYTHLRSSIQFGQTADNYHRVEQWGEPVRPYGEWRFPYRPFAQPYQTWGPPYAGLGPIGVFGGGFPGYGPGGWPGGTGGGNNPGNQFPDPNQGFPAGPGNPYPAVPGGGYSVPPHYDGFYPSYPNRPRLDDESFFSRPNR